MQEARSTTSLVDRLKTLGSPSFALQVVVSCLFFAAASGYLNLDYLAGLAVSGVSGILFIFLGVWRALAVESPKAEWRM
jgi:hypothetical protein